MKSVYIICMLALSPSISAEASPFALGPPSGCEDTATHARIRASECADAKTVLKASSAEGIEAYERGSWADNEAPQSFIKSANASATGVRIAIQHEQDASIESARSEGAGRETLNSVCPDCPEMISIPDSAFAIGKYTVTFEEWDACVADGGCGGYHPSDNGWGRENRPVINVNWNDAQAYVEWLSTKTGRAYRLPTEEEWEIAALAGATTKYYWGNDAGRNNANCDGCGSKWDNKRTAPVGSFKPNAFGLYDMMGNVWQWTESCWKGNCSKRMFCGGSWNHRPEDMAPASCNFFDTGKRMRYLGFRLALPSP